MEINIKKQHSESMNNINTWTISIQEGNDKLVITLVLTCGLTGNWETFNYANSHYRNYELFHSTPYISFLTSTYQFFPIAWTREVNFPKVCT